MNTLPATINANNNAALASNNSSNRRKNSKKYSWPDPRAAWPDDAKKILLQVVHRGRQKSVDSTTTTTSATTNPSSSAATQASSSAGATQQDPPPPLVHGSSDYNFSKPFGVGSSNKACPSVAAFLSFLAKELASKGSSLTPQQKKKAQQQDDDEQFLLFLGDLIDVACGPGGSAALCVTYPNNDSADWFKRVAAENGTKLQYVHTGGTSVANAGASGSGSGVRTIVSSTLVVTTPTPASALVPTAAAATSSSYSKSKTAAAAASAASSASSSSSLVVVEQCSPFAGQHDAHQRNAVAAAALGGFAAAAATTTTPAGSSATKSGGGSGVQARRRLESSEASASQIPPPEISAGFFRNTLAVRECPLPGLRAQLCRRPMLHLLPACMLWLVFASLPQVIEQYDQLREGGWQVCSADARGKAMEASTSSSGSDDEDDEDRARVVRQRMSAMPTTVLPPGLPKCVSAMLATTDLRSRSRRWKWVWQRTVVAAELLWSDRDGFGKVA